VTHRGLAYYMQDAYIRGMDKDTKDQRLPILVSRAELRDLDDWRARQPGVPSRGEAMRRALRLAIEASKEAAE
jgi:hypothetical protein